MSRQRVVVIGAGIGGLVSALELAAHGCDVLVLESAATPGGKMRELTVGGSAIDAGPTVFTMRWVFEELFEAVGANLSDHLALQPVEVLARHAWSATERLDLYADAARSADAIGSFAGAAARRGYLDFCVRASAIYRTLERPFLRGSRPNPVSLVARAGVRGLPELLRISPFATLWGELGKYFADPRLRQLFGRYATYCGASPFLAPATLMLVAHVEQQGVWLVDGGMHRIAQALATLAQARGARFRYGCTVAQISTHDGRACGVKLADGEDVPADAVVFNGDVAALAGGLLGPDVVKAGAPVAPAQRSLSALTWNLVAPVGGFPLSRHTVFFSPDYPAEFDDIVDHGRLPADPTVYVCAQDRGASGVGPVDDRTAAGARKNVSFGAGAGAGVGAGAGTGADAHAVGPPPDGHAERLLMIVNAPARGDGHPFTTEELARCEAQTFRRLAHCGLQLQPRTGHIQRTTPHDFERLFPGTGGALYGRASHGWAASFSRAGARSRLPGLYLAGGSVHPGPGVPMAALSGRQAAASVVADRAPTHAVRPASTARSRPADTHGGTSTR